MKFVLLFSFVLLVLFDNCFARVNLIEPYKPGIDTSFRNPDDYTLSIDVQENSDKKLPNLFAMPGVFSYGISQKMESSISMGLLSYGSQSGISDLDFGIKYLLDKGVCGEAGILLPTADYKHGLGYGGVAVKLNCLVEKNIKDITGYAALGYNIISNNIYDTNAITPGNFLTYKIGTKHTLTSTLKGFIEMKGMNHALSSQNGSTVQGSAYNELYIAPGINYQTENLFDFNTALLVGLTSESSNIIFFVGMDFK